MKKGILALVGTICLIAFVVGYKEVESWDNAEPMPQGGLDFGEEQNILPSSRVREEHKLTLLNDKEQDRDKQTVAVIVTFKSQGSYDRLFAQVQQKVMEGSKVEVYTADSGYLDNMISAFQGKPTDDVAVGLMKSISSLDPSTVTFNWECSPGYSNKQFPEGTDKLFKFLKMIINRGHMAMFSDFSLKALINNWSDKHGLGPNPFVQTHEYSGNFVLRFDHEVLERCPSAQLNILGSLSEGNQVNVHAMGGTIVYSVNQRNLRHNDYQLEVLTVVETLTPNSEHLVSKIGHYSGAAGHVLLTYPSGGTILTSMGHWIELMKIDTSAKKLLEVAERQYGKETAEKMRDEMAGMSEDEVRVYGSINAQKFIQNQAPGSNMLIGNRNKIKEQQ